MTTEYLIESVEYLRESLNTDTRTVKQIIIRAGMSKNKRNYPETVLKEAVSLFEGIPTYANHPEPKATGRDVLVTTGWIKDVHFDESTRAIVGTRYFAKTQAGKDVMAIVEDVVNGVAPNRVLGGSINALGSGKRADDGTLMVENITKAFSVDDVDTPAAGGGFEKLVASDGGIVQAVLAEATYEEWCESRPDYYKRLQKEMKVIRQSDAIKTVQAEADQLRETVEQTQERIAEQQSALEATLAELAKVRQELLVEKALQKSRLPVEWRDSLRQQLVESDPDKWGEIITSEQTKAKRVSKPIIEGVGSRRVHTPIPAPVPSKRDRSKPRDNEGYDAWAKRNGYIER